MVVLYDPATTSRASTTAPTPARPAILLGAALAAALVVCGPVRRRPARIALEVVGVAGVVVLACRVDAARRPVVRRSTAAGSSSCGVAAIAVIAAAVHPRTRPGRRACCSFQPLCLLGLISYGVYLWHWPVDVVLDEARVGVSGWPLFAVQLAVTLVIAIVSYLLIEMPIRRGAFSKRQWQIALPVLATGIVIVFVVASATTPTSALFRFKPAAWEDPPRVRPIRAGIGDQVGPVLVVGDSVSLSMASGLRNAGLDVTPFGFPAWVVRGTIKAYSAFGEQAPCPWTSSWSREVQAVQPTRRHSRVGRLRAVRRQAARLGDVARPRYPSLGRLLRK